MVVRLAYQMLNARKLLSNSSGTFLLYKTLNSTLTLSGPTSTLHVQASGSVNQREAADRGHFTQLEETSRCIRGTGHQHVCRFLITQCVSAGVFFPHRGLSARTTPGKRELFARGLTQTWKAPESFGVYNLEETQKEKMPLSSLWKTCPN